MGEDTAIENPASGPQDETDDLPALRVIGAFGGIRPMAGRLEVPVSTVQGWKARGVIPTARHDDIRAAATAHGIAIDEADLAASAEHHEDAVAAEPEDRSAAESVIGGTDTAGGSDRGAKPMSPPPSRLAASGAAALHRGGWFPGFVMGALVFALGAGGAVLIWGGSTGDGGLGDRLTALEGQLADLEQRPGAEAPSLEGLASVEGLERLSQGLAALQDRVTDTPAEVEDLAARLDGLESRVDALGSSAAAGADAATAVGGLNSQVEGLQGQLSRSQAGLDDLASQVAAMKADQDAALSSTVRQANLTLAVGQLRDSLRYSGAYGAALEDVKRLSADDSEVVAVLAPLEDHAATGVPTVAVLQADFPTVARKTVAAGYGDSYDGRWGEVLERVSEVISVRPVGKVEGDSPAAVVAAAEIHVEAGDLAAAVEELKRLEGGAGEAAAAWRGQAEGRLAADAAISNLNRLLTSKLASDG